MIVGLRCAAEYMTAQGRQTTRKGLQTLLSRGRHPGLGRQRPNGWWEFTEAELDTLIGRVRRWRRSEEAS